MYSDTKLIIKKVSIYCLKDPNSFEIRYIGKTENELTKRLTSHITESKNLKLTDRKNRWIRKLYRDNLKPTIEIIEEVSYDVWPEREIFWIKYYRDSGLDLTNILDGGQNPPNCKGRIVPQEIRDKISKSHKALNRHYIWRQESIDKLIETTANIKLKDKDYFIDLVMNKKTRKEIAEFFNVSETTVSTTAKRFGLKLESNKIKTSEYSKIIKLYNEGKRAVDIACDLNVHVTTIQRIIKKLGIPRIKQELPEDKRRLYKDDDLPSLKYLFDQKISMAKIAKKLNCGETTVGRIRDRMKDLNIID